jgi:type I restriction-modification system DNA methylase subunit
MTVKQILGDIINNFQLEGFHKFFRAKSSKYRKIDEERSHYNQDGFSNSRFLGEISFEDDEEMIVVSIKVSKSLTERSGKKAQFQIAKKILKEENRYTAGIFIFYDDAGNFRFSLVYEIPLPGGKRSWSNFKRYTYFVTKNQTNKTFLQQMEEADFSSLDKLIDAFSVEKVTKQFYQEIAYWYYWAMDNVEFPDDVEKDRDQRNAKSLIRLITRLIFVWFMKEKGLVPADLFDKAFADQVLNYKDKTGSTYYKAILQNLFFATLNTPMKKDDPKSRIFVEEARKYNYKSEAYLEQGYYRYSRFIKNKDLFLKTFENIPFLNGGLFESLDKGKNLRIDCFSDNPVNETRLKVPDYLFFLEKEQQVNLSKYSSNWKKVKVTGLLTILKKYNFTIDENTTIDQDVALDPELLGKVFENLLASFNPETSTTARKATGSYYTPREIVDFMVEEALIEYCKPVVLNVITSRGKQSDNNIENEITKLRKLLDYNIDENPFKDDEEITLRLIDAIEKIKVIDPACGSGAFPMGVLHKLVLMLHKLDPENTIWKERLIEKVPPEIRQETEKSFENKPLDYIRKLGLIEHCIYGVDIQEIAIQISKLRFFISLLVEQEIDDTKPNRDIRSLPNLETKFVAANTLIKLEKSGQLSLLDNDTLSLEKELFKVREEIFYPNSRWEKLKLQQKEKQLREKLKASLRKSGFSSELAEKIANWDPFDQNTHSDWFDPEYMFGVKDGFDIVIGNPPYIQLQKAFNKKIKYADIYKDQGYKTFDRMGDIYCLFYEKGIQLLKENGLLAYITSNKWMRAGYGEKLREFFSKYNPLQLVDLGPGVFENATVDTNILIIKKANNQNKLKAITLQKQDKENIFKALNEKAVVLTNLSKDAWFIGSDAEQKLKEKIEKIGKPLKDWDVKIFYGIKTGLNEAFIITTEKRNEILANCKDEEERKRTEEIIKPILRGRDIKRYYYEWAGLWVIGTFPALHLNIDNYPALKKYFLDNFDKRQLEQSGKKYPELGFDARKKTGNKWFETQDQIAYYPEFEKEKVVWQELAKGAQFSYDINGEFFISNTGYILTGNRLKYVLGYLNSKFNEIVYDKWYCTKLGSSGIRWLNQHVLGIPLPPITPTNEPIVNQIENLVDKILGAKKKPTS